MITAKKIQLLFTGRFQNLQAPNLAFVKNSSVLFADQTQTDGIHAIKKWSWNYGDTVQHDYATATTFTRIYNDTGYNTIHLKVTDTYGCTDSEVKENFVYVTHPYASFKMSDTVACPGATISLENTSNGINLNYLWNLDNGTQSTKTNGSVAYNNSGNFTPALTATDINGCISNEAQNVVVSQPASAI